MKVWGAVSGQAIIIGLTGLMVLGRLMSIPAVRADDCILEKYLVEGLTGNLALQQGRYAYEKSRLALTEARGAYFPTLDVQARYTRAGGGRTIEFPVGDLLNPVYGTLNQILSSQGQQPRFPENIENEEIAFIPEKYQETKVQLIQPLFQTALYHNVRLKKNIHALERLELERRCRQVIREIKTGYYNYHKAENVIGLLDRTRMVLEENLRLSQRLFENDKVTQDVVFRAEAELRSLEQQQAEAERDRDLAKNWFNFLLNRELDEPIEMCVTDEIALDRLIDPEEVLSQALTGREELKQQVLAIESAHQLVRIENHQNFPGLTGVVDYGIEGEMYRLSGEDDFWTASLVLHWNLFHGFQDRARQRQARCDVTRAQLQEHELHNQVIVQVKDALAGVEVAHKAITSTRERLRSARQSFTIMSRKYEVGLARQIEFLDARATYTNAEISHLLARYDYEIKYAELEYVAALVDLSLYPLPLSEGGQAEHE